MSANIQAYVTVAFVIVFCLIAAWAYWPSNRKKFDQDGRIPLDDDR